jgi:hypothetical protein
MIVVTEYLDGGELFDRVASQEYILTEDQCSSFIRLDSWLDIWLDSWLDSWLGSWLVSWFIRSLFIWTVKVCFVC